MLADLSAPAQSRKGGPNRKNTSTARQPNQQLGRMDKQVGGVKRAEKSGLEAARAVRKKVEPARVRRERVRRACAKRALAGAEEPSQRVGEAHNG